MPIRIETLGGGAGEVTQTASYTEDAVTVSIEGVWRATELAVTKVRFSGQGGDAECDFQPDLVDLRLPLARGKEWSNDVSCDMRIGTDQLRIRRVEQARVTNVEQLVVGGVAVDCFVIYRTITETYSGVQGEWKQEETGTEHFAPKYGLTVKSANSSKTSGADGRTLQTDRVVELLSVQPRPN